MYNELVIQYNDNAMVVLWSALLAIITWVTQAIFACGNLARIHKKVIKWMCQHPLFLNIRTTIESLQMLSWTLYCFEFTLRTLLVGINQTKPASICKQLVINGHSESILIVLSPLLRSITKIFTTTWTQPQHSLTTGWTAMDSLSVYLQQ